MSITVAQFLDVSEGVQPGQFTVGSHGEVASLDDLDPTYKQLLDAPYACVMSVIGGDGRPNLTPMWFDYDGDKVLVNVAEHRRKTGWIRSNPQISVIIVDPANMYHWVSMKLTVDREISEDDPDEGSRVTEQLDKIWVKYTQADPPYGLRDPGLDERRVLFECRVDRIATFGVP